jgi:uncharacterized protein (TIGR00251 family)
LSNQTNIDTIPKDAVKAVDNGVRISLHVQPGAKRSSLAGPYGDNAWKLAIQAPPVDNKANEAVQKLLANWMECPKGKVTLLSGQISRDKVFFISDITLEKVNNVLMDKNK